MLFELETALRFLRPQKSQLARTLIALSSLGVVSVVSWLVLVFYSVTEGLEKRWIDQMVQVSGSVRVVPTYSYFDHADFVIDSYSSQSGYQPTLLSQKIAQPHLEPSDLEALPSYLEETTSNSWTRPSHRVWQLLEGDHPVVSLCTGIQIEISQFREKFSNQNDSLFAPAGSYRLQQNAYLMSFYPSSESLDKLLQSPDARDFNDLCLALGQPSLQSPWPELENWLAQVSDLQLSWKNKQAPLWSIEETAFNSSEPPTWIQTEEWFIQKASAPLWNSQHGRWLHRVILSRKADASFEGWIPAGFMAVNKVSANPWKIIPDDPVEDSYLPILAPKILKDIGLSMGSLLHMEKEIPGPMGTQTYKRKGFIVGFYDSGIMPLGGRFLMAPYESVASWIEPAEQDPNTQFFQAWPKDPLQKAAKLKKILAKENLDTLFTVQSYEDFEASYDLLMQLRSDRLLLSIIAFIILIVASSSVCTMMVLLVNERRKEIAVLKTLGMSSKRLCSCFALSGLILGFLGASIGISLAWITLQNLDLLITYISYLQGSPLLNPIYYGKTLPNAMSPHAIQMVLVGNTLLALLGSCLAAWQTSRLNPPDLFRSL